MSTYVDDEKLARPRTTAGKAQATRKQLLARRGSRELSKERIDIDTMGGREEWKRITGDVFEQAPQPYPKFEPQVRS